MLFDFSGDDELLLTTALTAPGADLLDEESFARPKKMLGRLWGRR